MQSIPVSQFGQSLQQANPQKIVAISWETDDYKEEGPTFHLIDSIDQLLRHLEQEYAILDQLNFDDRRKVLSIEYRDDATVNYQLYRDDVWDRLKELLS